MQPGLELLEPGDELVELGRHDKTSKGFRLDGTRGVDVREP
ncbi:hypothetical protein [Saccharothrix algeriensis]|uniref:Uncharacterized protein n=1 Tax=Saccharothrix algeriensis TaxID=173560 RepID=A0ABS2SE52_9PSEU|nr:hypothetical protein [Saccharothrix algeriensis]MBM7814546.1 hypothetical protein [Saccharothrix algeriensis]